MPTLDNLISLTIILCVVSFNYHRRDWLYLLRKAYPMQNQLHLCVWRGSTPGAGVLLGLARESNRHGLNSRHGLARSIAYAGITHTREAAYGRNVRRWQNDVVGNVPTRRTKWDRFLFW